MTDKELPRFEVDKIDGIWLAQLDETLTSNPDDPDANCQKGNILLRLCRANEALEHFERALRQDPSHMRSWVGKGRVFTLQGEYDKAEECFAKVPKDDEIYIDAQDASRLNKWYDGRRGQGPTKKKETTDETAHNDELEHWMNQHINHIQNLEKLLNKFRDERDGQRRKDGHVFHAELVKCFYEQDSSLKVISVERNNIERDTDVDIELEDNILIQAWRGAMPLDHELGNILSGKRDRFDINWCEELKPVLKKLRQLPSKIGKGFVINCVPNANGFEPSPLYKFCTENKCVMMIRKDKPHIIVYGTSDFKYKDEACQIARTLGQPLRFLLGDWKELQAQGRDPIGESAYGINMSKPSYNELCAMNRNGLLKYAKQELKDPCYNDLINLDYAALLVYVLQQVSVRDSDCPEEEPRSDRYKSIRPYE